MYLLCLSMHCPKWQVSLSAGQLFLPCIIPLPQFTSKAYLWGPTRSGGLYIVRLCFQVVLNSVTVKLVSFSHPFRTFLTSAAPWVRITKLETKFREILEGALRLKNLRTIDLAGVLFLPSTFSLPLVCTWGSKGSQGFSSRSHTTMTGAICTHGSFYWL